MYASKNIQPKQLTVAQRDRNREEKRKYEMAHPPPRALTPVQRLEIALQTTAAVTNSAFASLDMFNCFQVATAATTTAYMAQSMRLRRVRVWGQPPESGTSFVSSVSVEFTAGNTQILSSGKTYSDTSINTVIAPFVDAKPPKNSIASWFLNQQANPAATLFKITAPDNSLIYLDFDYIINCTEAALAGSGGVGMSAGTIGGIAPANFTFVGAYNTLP
jgi:hypothetical protein